MTKLIPDRTYRFFTININNVKVRNHDKFGRDLLMSLVIQFLKYSLYASRSLNSASIQDSRRSPYHLCHNSLSPLLHIVFHRLLKDGIGLQKMPPILNCMYIGMLSMIPVPAMSAFRTVILCCACTGAPYTIFVFLLFCLLFSL